MSYFPPGYQNVNVNESPEIQRLRLQLANKERDSIIGLLITTGLGLLGVGSSNNKKENNSSYYDPYMGGNDPYAGGNDPYAGGNDPYAEQDSYEEYQDTSVQNPDYHS